MMTLIIGTAIALILIGAGIWLLVSLSRPNPPLPRQQVTIVPSAATSTRAIASASTTAASSTNADTNEDMNPPLPTEQLTIDGAVFDVEIASTTMEQARGLSNRPSLGANQGMLFIFSTPGTQSFWMKDMNFPLDMIWIGGNTVVGFSQNDPAEPNVASPSNIYFSPSNTDKVLEVNAGTVAKYNIQVGDSVQIK